MYYSLLLYKVDELFDNPEKYNKCLFYLGERILDTLYDFEVSNWSAEKYDLLVSSTGDPDMILAHIRLEKIIKGLNENIKYHDLYPQYIHLAEYLFNQNRFIIIETIKWKREKINLNFKVWRR